MNQAFNIIKKWSGHLGAFIMLLFGALAFFRWHQSGLLFYMLLAFRDCLASYYLVSRTDLVLIDTKRLSTGLSYVSSFLPLIYLSSETPLTEVTKLIVNILIVVGFTISTLALLDLGKSFGVSPGKRTLINTGLYKYFDHPMYSGYLIAEFGMCFLNLKNIPIYLTAVSLYFYRIKIENELLRQ